MCTLCFTPEKLTSDSNIIKNQDVNAVGGVNITAHTPSSNEVGAIDGSVKWSSNNLDVSFATTSISAVQSEFASGTINNFSSNVKNGILEIFDLIDDVCALNFNIMSDGNLNAELLLWETTDSSNLGIAVHGGGSGNTSSGMTGDTFCDVFASTSVPNYESNFSSNYGKGSDAFYTWVHEIGHALGLGHTHDNGFGSDQISGYSGDSFAGGLYGLNYGLNTVMSYNAYNDDYPATGGMIQGNSSAATGHCVLGAWDIYALQQKYGLNLTHNAGNTTYTLNDYSWGFQSIWDAGGTDTISHAGQSSNCVINLTAATLDTGAYSGGGWSYTASKNYGISIANGAVIENAIGGLGNDTLTGNTADNTLNGGAGNDTLISGNGSDIFLFNTLLNGVSNVDTLTDFNVLEDKIQLDPTIFSGLSTIGSGNFVSAAGATALDTTDFLIFNTTNNFLYYDADGSGVGTMVHFATLNVDITSHTSFVNAIIDEEVSTLSSSVTVNSLPSNFHNLTLTGTSAINGTGNALDNTITGNSNNNTLNGGAGTDILIGGEGNDTYIVDSASDTIIELEEQGTDTVQSSANYVLTNNVENLTLTGKNAINATGNTLANTLVGNGAANILNGGTGNDTLTGGTGLDIFLFDTALGVSNVDTLTDFNLTQDKIRLDDDIFLSLSSIEAENFVSAAGATALDTTDFLIFNTTNNFLYYDADGNGDGAMVHFATLNVDITSHTSFELIA